MKSLKISRLLLVIVFIASCKSKTIDNGYYSQNFDDIKIWAGDQRTLSNNVAHSGEWSSKMDANNEFSLGFVMDMKKINEKGYKKVKASAWGYLSESDAKTSFVITVDGADKPIAYSADDFRNFIKGPKTWGRITARLTLPDLKGKDAVVKVYALTSNKKEAYVDDFEIQFEK